MLKSPELLAQLEHVADDAQIFARALILKPERVRVGRASRIDDFSRIEGGEGVDIGDYVHVSSFSSIFGGGGCIVGNYVSLAEGSRVITGSDQLDAAMSAVAPSELRHVETVTTVIDHLAFLGTGAILLPGASLALGAVAAAGAVVREPVPAWEVWGGVPARRIAYRDPEPLRQRGIDVAGLEAASRQVR